MYGVPPQGVNVFTINSFLKLDCQHKPPAALMDSHVASLSDFPPTKTHLAFVTWVTIAFWPPSPIVSLECQVISSYICAFLSLSHTYKSNLNS